MGGNPPAAQETWVGSLGREDPLEEGMATHSSYSSLENPWTEEPGGLWGCKEWDTAELLSLPIESPWHLGDITVNHMNVPSFLELITVNHMNVPAS